VTNEFPDRVLIGETYLPDIVELAKMYGAANDELHLAMDTQLAFVQGLSAERFRLKLKEAETGLHGKTPLLFLDNHDNPRSWTRFGNGKNDLAIAKLLATLLLAPRASVLLYYGEEIGMENNDPKRVEDVRDPIGKIGWPKQKGRDGERTPMQWDAGLNAGFSRAKTTWLPVTPSYKERNVAAETKDPNSLLNYYKALIRLRKENPALREGEFTMLAEANPNVLAWVRKTKDDQAVLVALNFAGTAQSVSFNLAPYGIRGRQAAALAGSFGKAGEIANLSKLVLPAYGAYAGQVR
jgi:alpha-glucosidase